MQVRTAYALNLNTTAFLASLYPYGEYLLICRISHFYGYLESAVSASLSRALSGDGQKSKGYGRELINCKGGKMLHYKTGKHRTSRCHDAQQEI